MALSLLTAVFLTTVLCAVGKARPQPARQKVALRLIRP
jgi:hypothetical protein